MISQKIATADQENPFQFSFHVMDRGTFDRIVFADGKYPDLPALGEGASRPIHEHLWDFREEHASTEDYFQRTFDGSVLAARRYQPKATGGVISRVPIFLVREGKFYPGLHQNIILPGIEIRHEDPMNDYRLPMLAFKYQVLERLRREQQLRPSELLAYSYCHTRGSNLSPFVRRAIELEQI